MRSHPPSTIIWSMTWCSILLKNGVGVIVNPWDKMISQNIDIIIRIHVPLHYNQRSNSMPTKTPQNITDTPPNLTVGWIQSLLYVSSGLLHILAWPSDWKSANLDSSDYTTCFYSSVQFCFPLHHPKQLVQCLMVKQGFFRAV